MGDRFMGDSVAFPLSERVLRAGYLEDLGTQPAEVIRARSRECQDTETAVSFARRVLQGRLDIVDSELTRRLEGGPADVGGLGDLIERLPQILADAGHGRSSGTGHGRRPFDPGLEVAAAEDLLAAVDAVAGIDVMTSLPTLRDVDVTSVSEQLRVLEQDLSHTRRELHRCIDALRSELSGRYERGELTVDELLG